MIRKVWLVARPAYEHVPFVDDDDKAVLKGIGWLFWVRTLVLESIADVGIVAVVAWLTESWWVAVGVGALALSMLAWSWAVRLQRLKLVRLGRHFHHVAHYMRDGTVELRAALTKAPGNYAEYNQVLMKFHDELVNRVARYFEELLGERTATCSLRVAVPDPKRPGMRMFQTIAWSTEMKKDLRRENSVPLPEDEGIPRHLRRTKQLGVFFVWNRQEAAKHPDIWFTTPTDDYKDLEYLMVAPVNGTVDGERQMMALLYVQTKKKPIEKLHAEHLMGFADMLGLMYPITARRIETANAESVPQPSTLQTQEERVC